jgi:TolB-like protein
MFISLRTIAIIVISCLSASILIAQPPKERTVANKPATASTTTASAQNTAAPATSKKKSLVVLDFNDSSLIQGATQRPIGKQIATLLTAEFARRGGFTVISQRDKEIAEERLKSHKTGKDGSYASAIGRELSANLVVFGDVIEYTVTTETKNQYIKKEIKNVAKVGFTLTLVDVATNEVKDGVTVEHVATSKDKDFGIINNSKILTEDQKITMLTEAAKEGVVKAVNELVQLIDPSAMPQPSQTTAAAGGVPASAATTNSGGTGNTSTQNSTDDSKKKKGFLGTGLFGGGSKEKKPETTSASASSPSGNSAPAAASGPRIAAINGAMIFVRNLPAATKVGTKLIVYRVGNKTIDKATGEILFQEENTVGELEVIQVTDKAFICKIVSGANIVDTDLVKPAN